MKQNTNGRTCYNIVLLSGYFSVQNRFFFMVWETNFYFFWFSYKHKNPRTALQLSAFCFFLPTLSFLILQQFFSKRSCIVLRCVVPLLFQYIERNSQLYTDCITPLDECYFPSYIVLIGYKRKTWLYQTIIMIFYKVLETLEWFEIKNKCVLWEVHNIVIDDNLFYQLESRDINPLFSSSVS